MTTLRLALSAPLRPRTYRRWVHLVLGGVLLLPIAIAVLVVASLLDLDGTASAPATLGLAEVVAVLLAATLGGLVALVPAVASHQLTLARDLLGGRLAALPAVTATSWPGRLRAAVWTAGHLIVGMAVSLATMIGLTEAALLALSPLAPLRAEPTSLVAPVLLEVVGTSAASWVGPALGAALVLVLLYAVALVGAGAARLAPVLLGPSATDRLAAAQARADDLTVRNRLATELHDAIGHALSVVSLQAAAAAQVLDQDPVFARDALEAIADQARTATAELDHVLGLIGEGPAAVEPLRNLADLPRLVEAARATGTDLRVQREGPLDDVAPALSRELYRLCQEAITNALRHGEPGVPVTLELRRGPDRLEVRVTNRVVGRRSARSGGRGLDGMRDRVRLLGGDLEAGADGDRWQLRAQVPLVSTPRRAAR